MFYIKCGVLNGQPYPEPVEIRGTTTNRADLDEADVVVTNIHQLSGAENRWLQDLPEDFFDLILFDHWCPAKFPEFAANILKSVG
jgi:hypothetical protein